MPPHRVAVRVTLPAWAPEVCLSVRDCGCCGARGALACVEPPDHASVHAFVCRACGRDKDC